jgi:hypothetical protein|tara:strand:- start:188 stop:736 length:549 start_codon:yes stop_codon:yes gene_type:complete
MEKVILNEEILYYGYVKCPKGYEIDRESIKYQMMYSYLNNKDKQRFTFDHTIHLDYLGAYIRDFHYQKVNYEYTLVNKEISAVILKQGESTKRKNEIDPFDIKNSPTYVLVYGVELEDNSSNVIVHYNRLKMPKCTWTIPIQNNKFIIFPAHLDYEITANTSKLNGYYLIQTLDEYIYDKRA